jgi:hypothetical protein
MQHWANRMEIVLGRGVGPMTFGLTEHQVVERLGQPDKVVLDANQSRDLMYYAQRLVLKIEPHGRLGWIEVHNAAAEWNGVKPWAEEQERLVERLCQHLARPAEFGDYGAMESYWFGDACIELQYVLGRLEAFNFGVLYGADDQPIWPEPTPIRL